MPIFKITKENVAPWDEEKNRKPESIKAWQAEFAALTTEHDADYETLKQYREEVRELDSARQLLNTVTERTL